MFLLSFIRGLYKALSADASPAAIAFGVAFGVTAGCVPITSRLGLFLICLILIVRVQVSAALFAWSLARLFSLAGVASLFNPVGASLLRSDSLAPFWTWALNLPIVAWLQLEHDAIFGGLVIGGVLGAALFMPIRLLVVCYRRWMADKLSESKFFQWLVNFWVLKALRFVFVGAR